jgi:hypothetical protein
VKIYNPQEYIGKRYGSLIVLKYNGKYIDGSVQFTCQCDCGKEFISVMREPNKLRSYCINCEMKIKRKQKSIKLYDYYGEKLKLSELAKKLGIKYRTLYSRIHRYKWNIDRWAKSVKKYL